MATPDQIPTDLTIDLGDDLSPEEFVAAVRNFMGYVAEITDAQKGDGADVSWTVRVREGSALVGVEPNAGAPQSRLAMIYNMAGYGPLALARGDIAGAGLSEKAINHLKSLSDLVSKHKNGKGVNLWVKKKPVGIGVGIAKIIREDWETDYHDFGTIEGRLEAIQDASGSLKIRVKDFLYPKAINCIVPERMIDHVLGSFRKRVEIEGRIHYRRDGTPISIEAQVIDVLPEDSELPTADEVRGIMAGA
ncbi:hypothetical protein [Roseovarius sp.]|uniref:hypothetical protein n=1 Tax=Roseovarius sp. TaxID=1486281 RepID=UPI003A984BB2